MVSAELGAFREQLVEVLKVYDVEAEEAKRIYSHPHSSSASYGTWRLLTGKALGLARAIEELDKQIKEGVEGHGSLQRASEG